MSDIAYHILETNVRNEIKKHNLIVKGESVLVGVSGGPDSITLLYILKELSSEWGLKLYTAHLNHMFRGEESVRDADFVKKVSDKLDIPCFIEYFDCPDYCKENKISKQVGARDVRYKFLNRIANETHSDKIALGHTADDQIETFLMRLLRGSGSTGLSGIPIYRGSQIIRPLLSISKEQILCYLKEKEIPYIIDSSNLELIYLRNKLRNEIVPVLKRYNPNLLEVVNRETDIIHTDNVALERYTEKILSEIIINRERERIDVDIKKFNSLDEGIKRRIIRCCFKEIKGDIYGLSYINIMESIDTITSGKTGTSINLPSNIIIEKGYDAFSIRNKKEVHKISPYEINIHGTTFLDSIGIRIETTITQGSVKPDHGDQFIGYFDWDLLSGPIIIRSRENGDFFFPPGLKGKRKKIHDLFIDNKIPRDKRDLIPIIVNSGNILWIVGVGIDNRFITNSSTKTSLIIKITKQ